MKALEIGVEAAFVPTKFSLARISMRDLVAEAMSLVRNSGLGVGVKNLILTRCRESQLPRASFCRNYLGKIVSTELIWKEALS